MQSTYADAIAENTSTAAATTATAASHASASSDDNHPRNTPPPPPPQPIKGTIEEEADARFFISSAFARPLSALWHCTNIDVVIAGLAYDRVDAWSRANCGKTMSPAEAMEWFYRAEVDGCLRTWKTYLNDLDRFRARIENQLHTKKL